MAPPSNETQDARFAANLPGVAGRQHDARTKELRKYVEDQMVKRYAGGGISAWKKYLGSWGDAPAGAEMIKNYDTAVATRPTPSDSLKTRYFGQTRRVGTTFSAHVPGAAKLQVYADAKWTTTRSTTGYVIMLAEAAILHASRRQHCHVDV